MNWFGATEFKVGVMVLVIGAIIVTMSLQISEDPSYLGSSKKAWFLVPDASGLIKKSSVKLAGIDVGVIKDIQLRNGLAYVELAIRPDVKLTSDSKIEIRANGILGDKYVEIIPGDFTAAAIGDGAQINEVRDVGSLASLMNEVGKIAGSLGNVAKSLEAAATGDGDTNTPLGRIVNNLEVFTGDLAELSSGKKKQIGEMIDNVHNITEELNSLVSDHSDSGFKAAWGRMVRSLDRVERSLKNIEEVTDKVNNGDGTIAQLINDDETVDGINSAIENVNEFFGGASKIQTTVDFHSEFLPELDSAKSFLNVKIQPGLDRHYEIALVDDPRGLVKNMRTVEVTDPDSSSPTTNTTDTTKTFKNKVKFTALYAKNFFNFSIKGGIIENTGGVGLDYYLFGNKKYTFGIEAFKFTDLYLRSFFKWSFYKGIYIVGGGDDILGNSGTASAYVGAGLYLTNDDLKLLLSGL